MEDLIGGTALSNKDWVLQLRHSIISNNTARQSGAGIYSSNFEWRLFDSVISNNTIKNGYGGGIYSFVKFCIFL